MKYFYTPLLLALVIAHSSLAQDKKAPVTVNWMNKSGYRYIPKQVFADTVAGTGGAVTDDSKELQLSWLSPCTDGTYKMYITPEQIFLTTSHYNANPNKILWVIDIDQAKFDQIAEGFKQTDDLNTKIDDTHVPAGWATHRPADTTVHRFCESELDKQVTQCFEFINSLFPKKAPKITFPTLADLHKVHAKNFGSPWVKTNTAKVKK